LETKEKWSNIKKGLIKWLRTCKLTYIILFAIIMVNDINGYIGNTISKLVQAEDNKELVLKLIDMCNIVRKLVPNVYVRWAIRIFIGIIGLLIIYFRIFYKEPSEEMKKTIHILGHATLGKAQFLLDDEVSNTVYPNLDELNLIEDMKTVQENFSAISYVVNKQDNSIERFKYKINNSDMFGYMGISHTPLALRAGYKIGDETRFKLFHKKRKLDYYEELDNSESYTPIKIEHRNIKENSKELIVTISTTFQIQDNELAVIHPEKKSIIKFKTDEMGFDVITSRKQVDEYLDFIFKEIRKVSKEKRIAKIHMVISSSVAFTFALGQGLSKYYDPEVIIYHFDINNPKKYPWGVSLFKDYLSCIVVN
jgi:hypothetical protein